VSTFGFFSDVPDHAARKLNIADNAIEAKRGVNEIENNVDINIENENITDNAIAANRSVDEVENNNPIGEKTPDPAAKSGEIVLNKTPVKIGNQIVPSPFKRALFWPQPIQTATKTKKKEKIPSVVTSKNWQQYYENKENLKKEQKEMTKKRLEERRNSRPKESSETKEKDN
jgi:hypothetical protein